MAPPGSVDHPQRPPEGLLRLADRLVGHQQDLGDMALGDGEHDLPHAPGRQGIGGDAAGLGIHRRAGRQRLVEGGGELRLDADDLDPSGIPGSDAADEPAAAHRHEERVEIGRILLEFQPDAALAEQGLGLVIGMDGQRPRLGGIAVAGRQRHRHSARRP